MVFVGLAISLASIDAQLPRPGHPRDPHLVIPFTVSREGQVLFPYRAIREYMPQLGRGYPFHGQSRLHGGPQQLHTAGLTNALIILLDHSGGMIGKATPLLHRQSFRYIAKTSVPP